MLAGVRVLKHLREFISDTYMTFDTLCNFPLSVGVCVCGCSSVCVWRALRLCLFLRVGVFQFRIRWHRARVSRCCLPVPRIPPAPLSHNAATAVSMAHINRKLYTQPRPRGRGGIGSFWGLGFCASSLFRSLYVQPCIGKWKMHSEIRTLNFTHCLRFIALVKHFETVHMQARGPLLLHHCFVLKETIKMANVFGMKTLIAGGKMRWQISHQIAKLVD